MIATLLTIALITALFLASRYWWRSHLNPVSIGIIAWSPGLIMMNWQPTFLSPVYIHLNRPIVFELYVALAIGFLSFWAGCATVKGLSQDADFEISPIRVHLDFSVVRAGMLFFLGFSVFVYTYINSGLLDLRNLDGLGVAESRLRLHGGLISFLVFLMDISAIASFARFVQRKQVIYLVPMLIAIACQAATLQKSRFVFLIVACVFVAALNPKETYELFWKTVGRRAMVVSTALLSVVLLFVMNSARGIGADQMTAASSGILEQIYIYSGAAAIQNVSVTLEGYLPSDAPAMGLYLGRFIFWHFVDPQTIFATRYFEGINAATYLIYGWADFRWLGFAITPFIAGMIVMTFIRFALRGSLLGLVLGVVAMQAVIYSSNTDVLFDPTTAVLLAFAVTIYVFSFVPGADRRKRRLLAYLADYGRAVSKPALTHPTLPHAPVGRQAL